MLLCVAPRECASVVAVERLGVAAATRGITDRQRESKSARVLVADASSDTQSHNRCSTSGDLATVTSRTAQQNSRQEQDAQSLDDLNEAEGVQGGVLRLTRRERSVVPVRQLHALRHAKEEEMEEQVTSCQQAREHKCTRTAAKVAIVAVQYLVERLAEDPTRGVREAVAGRSTERLAHHCAQLQDARRNTRVRLSEQWRLKDAQASLRKLMERDNTAHLEKRRDGQEDVAVWERLVEHCAHNVSVRVRESKRALGQ